MSRDSIIEKVRKLLALASNNPSANEAGVAAARAQALMMEHKIAQLEIEAEGDEGEDMPGVTTIRTQAHRIQWWRKELMSILAPLCFCKVVVSIEGRGRQVRHYVQVIGTETDTQVFADLYRYLEKQIVRLAEEAGGGTTSIRPGTSGRLEPSARRSTTWMTQFKRGAVRGVEHRLAEQARSTVADTRALAVYNRAQEKNAQVEAQQFSDAVVKKPPGLVLEDATTKGIRAGYRIDVQLPGQTRKLAEGDA